MSQADDAITRSEEELEVHTRSRVVGRVRLRKRIVTETVQVSVPVRREELEIVREEAEDEPYDDIALGGDEQAHTIVLATEEPVVSVRVVATERVRIHKELVTESRTLSADLKREQVELERDPPGAG